MNIIKAIKREEKLLAKQSRKLQNRIESLRVASQALASVGFRARAISSKPMLMIVPKKTHKLSRAGRAAIVKASKLRWSKFHSKQKKAA